MYGQAFAEAYDALMADVGYDEWAGYYAALAARHGIKAQTLVDCACGTGEMALRFAKGGARVTGVDGSDAMLRVAADKARGAGLPITFAHQDMRELTLHRPVDAILCACDGVNYLTRGQDVLQFFKAAHRALVPGGGLLFDVSSPYKLEHLLGERCLCGDGREVAYLWQNHFSPRTRLLQMDLSFFVLGKDGRYARFDETHCQRAHTESEIVAWLREAGFREVFVYGDRTYVPPREAEARLHFVARKEGA